MTRNVRVVGAPTDYGANRRGVDMGPSAIRYAGLAEELARAGREVVDDGDVRAPRAEERDPEAEPPASGRAKFLRETREVATRLADRVAGALDAGELPLVLGGDHSVAIGSVTGSARDAEIGAVWFDAHGDFNTPETSPSGNVHGMPLAAVLGVGEFADVEWANAGGLRAENVAIVGLRSVDPSERPAIADSDVTTFTMSDVDERGIASVADDALDVAAAGTDGVHVSLDLDWLDPREAPGVGTPVRGGVTYREAHAALETVAERDRLRSLDLVEVNPILDERNETASLATELAASALGKQIL
ncbi:arginase [Halobellus limi]|uniref:Arginase n=1 Tax=Halobellus limi TaxID=699433 RepID=A0A1H5T895_9EURY|nr:arginase [Halobellus limi]QCC47378.1 arginase [Halobellus limi]SEF59006.1 arginase [Halobellus limi]